MKVAHVRDVDWLVLDALRRSVVTSTTDLARVMLSAGWEPHDGWGEDFVNAYGQVSNRRSLFATIHGSYYALQWAKRMEKRGWLVIDRAPVGTRPFSLAEIAGAKPVNPRRRGPKPTIVSIRLSSEGRRMVDRWEADYFSEALA